MGSRKRDLSKVLVIDVESSCWKTSPPPGQQSEIIEIGISVLDLRKKEIVKSEGIFVKPEYSEISDFCTELTTITQEQVDTGVSFYRACEVLKNLYNSENTTWASWGDYDRVQFERCCKLHKCKYPFGRTHINVKNLFALSKGLDKEVGVDIALKMMKMPFEGVHHRGVDDSINIAKLFLEIL